MVRTVQSSHNDNLHLPDDGDYDEVVEDMTTPTATTHTSSLPGVKNSVAKPSRSRSKHSVTEQRRRSKINERFQILRDLIPPNDQKRDKASLLLEVIEYIKFLQEKLQIYEGPYQQLSDEEPTKLIPWDIAEPDYNADYAYRRADYPAGSSNATASLNTPCDNAPTEKLACVPYGWSINECAVIQNEDTGSNSLSSVYSQGLLKKLTDALQTSGVDMSNANISVQLDVRKTSNASSVSISLPEDTGTHGLYAGKVLGRDFGAWAKKHRT